MNKFFQYIDINEWVELQTNTPISIHVEQLVGVFQKNGAIIENTGADMINFRVPFVVSGSRGSIFQGMYLGKLIFVESAKGAKLNYQISILPIRILAIGFILFGIVVPVYLLFTSNDIETFPLLFLPLFGGFVYAVIAYFVGALLIVWRFQNFLTKTLKTSMK